MMGSSGNRSELDTQLARVTIERLRTLIPILVIALGIALITSEPTGIPLTWQIVVVNFAVMGVLTALFAMVRLERLPLEHADKAAALVAVIGPFTTLASEASSGVPLAMVIMVELGASSLQISSRWMIATSALVVAAWMPLGIRDGGERVAFHVTMVVAAGVVSTIVQVVLRRALIRTEQARIEEHKAAEALAVELAERRKAETERAQIYDQLVHAQRMEAIGTLAAGLAHDMNNILAGIMSSAELIAVETKDPDVREDCSRIVDEAERGAVLTRSLLAFSRRGQYKREAVALDAITTSIEPLLSRTLPKTIQIEYRGGVSPIVDADVVQIGQALVNLCINASDAMEGNGKLTIERDERMVPDAEADELGLPRGIRVAVLSVTDTGHGMDETTKSRIFEPFFTTKAQGKGTGLGLSMVYGTVQGHDGAIRVKSAPGKGSTFEIFLPVTEGDPTPKPDVPVLAQFSASQLVLVADDEPLVRVATARILEKLGFQVLHATDGDEALLEFAKRADEIGLVVLDMAMPRMGGAECFRRIREASKVPILIASGHLQATETEELLAMGPTSFVEKPFTAAQLSLKVEQLLARGRCPAVELAAWQAASESRS